MNFLFSLTAKSDSSFFEDVWNYLYDVYLRVDGNYENLGFENMPLLSLRLIVLGIFVGGVGACLAMAYNKQVLGGIVRRIISKGAIDRENAMSADDLGFKKNFLARYALASSHSLKSIVKCVEEEQFLAEQAEEKAEYDKKREENKRLPKFKELTYLVDIENATFYIPEELRIRAEIKFEKKGSGWLNTVFAIVGLSIVFFLLLLVLPQILGYIDGLL